MLTGIRRTLHRLAHRAPGAATSAGRGSAGPGADESEDGTGPDVYTREAPSAQLAVDLFAGTWSSRLPADIGVDTGGVTPLFEDERLAWGIEQVGAGVLDGARVLELGPLEGGHSFMLHHQGAEVLAVESNSRAYLKCLVIKEVLGLDRCHFLYGDFNGFLADEPGRFDLAVASGVLYHAEEPLDLLDGLGAVADRLVIWTHYYDEEIVRANPGISRHFSESPRRVEREGITVSYHRRDYLEALSWKGFCGGPSTFAHWLTRADLLAYLAHLGYGDVRVGLEEPGHVNGPSILLYAARSS